MKTFLRLALSSGLVAASLLTGCQTMPGDPGSHWNVDSVDNRIAKHFTGYRGPLDGSYVHFQAQKKADIALTLRRHFLNNNPMNPFQTSDPSLTAARAPYGPLPNPFNWFNFESLFFGAILSGWQGTFIPIPVDSLIALLSDGGAEEFGQTFTGDWSGELARPPSPSSFRVKNR